jgi:ketosteroid isomerase-like protein
MAALVAVVVSGAACNNPERMSADERQAIADSLQSLVTAAHDFSQPDVAKRLLALYPDSGRVISATGGHVSTTKSALTAEIASFWQRVGQNMREPQFELGSAYVDVLTPNAAVMTFSYRIPHTTPLGRPHIVAGAWTALWRRQEGRWMIVQEHLSDTPETSAPLGSPSDTGVAGTRPHNMPGHVMPGGSKK